MAKVKNQNIPAQEILYSPDPQRPYTIGEAYVHTLTEGHNSPVEEGQLIVQKTPRNGRPRQRGKGTPAQATQRDCFKCCAEMWRNTPNFFKNCVKEIYNSTRPGPKTRQIPPEWYSTPYSTFMGECLKKCRAIGNCEFSPFEIFTCPDTRCTGATIGFTTNQMQGGETQNLTILNPNPAGSYELRIISGGGEIDGDGKYYAPNTNPNCQENVTIALICYETIMDTLEIAINTGTGLAGYVDFFCQTQRAIGLCAAQIKAKKLYCDGSTSTSYYACSPGTGGIPCTLDNYLEIWEELCQIEWGRITCQSDTRTTEQLLSGCCPTQLF